jgi:hypothetical protein
LATGKKWLLGYGILIVLFCQWVEHLKERLAVSVAMFPRGEVGAAVLFVALGYGIRGLPVTLAGLSLALNLLLTGVFISAVLWLISPTAKSLRTDT